MAYSFLVFDFGGNEDVAQQARLKAEGWKQGFRLGKKLELHFDRKETGSEPKLEPAAKPEKAATRAKEKSKAASKFGKKDSEAPGKTQQGLVDIRMIVRLDFSNHEKLSLQRWLDRIPVEEPFKSANPKIIRAGDAEFEATSNLFEITPSF